MSPARRTFEDTLISTSCLAIFAPHVALLNLVRAAPGRALHRLEESDSCSRHYCGFRLARSSSPRCTAQICASDRPLCDGIFGRATSTSTSTSTSCHSSSYLDLLYPQSCVDASAVFSVCMLWVQRPLFLAITRHVLSAKQCLLSASL